ncbi:MAG: bifunctional nuclease family protein [Ilumatobacteraceae bacterium]
MRSMSVRRVERDRSTNSWIVTLRETETSRRQFDIFVGAQEGLVLRLLLDGETTPRPLSHDLFVMTLERLGVGVKHVVLTHVNDRTFFAELVLAKMAPDSAAPGTDGGEDTVVSCRPSDGLAIALRANAPVYAREELLDEVGREPEDTGEDSAEILDEFRDFIENISPEDFDI